MADHYEEKDEGDCCRGGRKDLCDKSLLVLDKVFRHLRLCTLSPILCIVVGQWFDGAGKGLLMLEKVVDSSHFWSYNTLFGSCL